MKYGTSSARGLTLTAFSIVAFSISSFAQSTDQAAKLISLPKLQPRPKTERHMFGTKMTVTVAVDAKGKVTAVNSIDGPGWVCPHVVLPEVKALRTAAEVVAKKAFFEPAVSGGRTVASAAVIAFEFPVSEIGTKVTGVMVGTDQNGSDTVSVKVDSPQIRGRADASVGRNAEISPKPVYPAAARAVRASGKVSIKVLISEDGSILSAEPFEGHPLLRNAARIAACGAKFYPTYLSGEPVKISGIIAYNFVP